PPPRTWPRPRVCPARGKRVPLRTAGWRTRPERGDRPGAGRPTRRAPPASRRPTLLPRGTCRGNTPPGGRKHRGTARARRPGRELVASARGSIPRDSEAKFVFGLSLALDHVSSPTGDCPPLRRFPSSRFAVAAEGEPREVGCGGGEARGAHWPAPGRSRLP